MLGEQLEVGHRKSPGLRSAEKYTNSLRQHFNIGDLALPDDQNIPSI
jgi:hypothetical protein